MLTFETVLPFTIAAIWATFAQFGLVRALHRLPGGSEGWVQFRGLIMQFSFGNLCCGAAPAGYGLANLLSTDLGGKLLYGAAGFLIIGLCLQFSLGTLSHFALERVGVVSWQRSAYTIRLVSSQTVLLLPISLTAVVAGCVVMVLDSSPGPTESAAMLALFAACLVWIIQWPAVRLASLPGAPADIPDQTWERAARQLGSKMGIEVKDVLLLRTHRAPLAGAFALPGHRAAITDHLLSALTLDEFLAIMAHEFTHFSQRKQSSLWFASAMLLIVTVSAGCVWLAHGDYLLDAVGSVIFLIVTILALLPLVSLQRRHEDEADENAVRYADPFALMTGIAKTYALNGRHRSATGNAKYRSLTDRLHRIAKLGGLEPGSVEGAIAIASEFDWRSSKVFSPRHQARQN